MANEIRSRTNLVAGALTAGLSVSDTAMSSAGLATLGTIDATNYAAISIFAADGNGRVLVKEIVWVTAHVAGASSATIVRAQETTSAQAWAIGSTWAHAPTVKDLEGVGFGTLGYAQAVATQAGITTVADVTGCSIAVYVGTSRRIKVTGQGPAFSSIAADLLLGRIKEGATSLGVWFRLLQSTASLNQNGTGSVVLTPTAGLHTYKLTMERESGTGSISISGSATNPAFILVEDIGPA